MARCNRRMLAVLLAKLVFLTGSSLQARQTTTAPVNAFSDLKVDAAKPLNRRVAF